MDKLKKLVLIVFVASLGGIVALGVNKLFSNDSPNTIEEMQSVGFRFTNNQKISDQPAYDFVQVAEVSTPAVVHIKTTITPVNNSDKEVNPFDFFGEGFGFGQPNAPRQASGSGVVITEDGYIITNNHVINNADKIEVTLNDKRSFVAELVGADPSTDLALLKINESGLKFLSFGNSDELKVGEWVVAVGNPFNLTSTVTAGIVSAKGRNIDLLRTRDNQYAIENFIQTDAAVNPGNSGGALVDTRGQLIGINTAIASKTGSYSGYSFAVPVNIAKKVMNDLLKYGEVKRAILGVQIGDITAEFAEEKDFPNLKGVYIAGVIDKGAGKKAGLKKGDVILKINDVEVNSSSKLQEEVGKYHPGDEVTIVYRRGDDEKTLDAVLQSRSGDTKITQTEKKKHNEARGLVLESLSKEEMKKLKIKSGVKVSEVKKGPFSDKGVKPGFVITQIDKINVYSVNQAIKLLESKDGGTLIEGKESDGDDLTVGLNLSKE
jgi:serine protease Do